MKRHRAECLTWKGRHRGTVQMARLASTMEARYGAGVIHPMYAPGVGAKQRATNLERYGAENVFSRESSLFEKVQASMDGKRLGLHGDANPFAWPEVQEKLRATNLSRYGVGNPQQSPEVRARTQETNLGRYGTDEVLAAPVIRERILATNQERYGGPAPSCSPVVVERTRLTNQERWGVDWTCQVPEVRHRQLDTMIKHYGSHFFASEEGRAKIRDVLISRYGVDHPAKVEGFWDRTVATFIRKYGTTHPLLLSEFLDKRRETSRRKYGVDHPMQDPAVYQRAVVSYRQACLQRFGVPNAMMVPEIALRSLTNAGGRGAPNRLEARFSAQHPNLLYTGNGAFWRWLPRLGAHKNPDFILPGPDPAHPKQGVTRVVELFGDYWHSCMFTGKATFEHESELIDAYRDIGIECLILWEGAFNADPGLVQAQVTAFLGDTPRPV